MILNINQLSRAWTSDKDYCLAKAKSETLKSVKFAKNISTILHLKNKFPCSTLDALNRQCSGPSLILAHLFTKCMTVRINMYNHNWFQNMCPDKLIIRMNGVRISKASLYMYMCKKLLPILAKFYVEQIYLTLNLVWIIIMSDINQDYDNKIHVGMRC